ncbi:hypothetical protein E4U41_002440 [Claviceps citrina]|nr:hypothetical protein E4U41_002440 [Claviceps citrina]
MGRKLASLPTGVLSACRTTTLSASSPHSRSSSSNPRLPGRLLNSQQGQVRHATFIHRPRRPYTMTQLVTLSDGSTYTMRTTSPLPLYRASKDTRNTLLWQPSEKSLRNVELDEAGKLAAFRARFGRAFDAAAAQPEEGGAAPAEAEAAAAAEAEAQTDMDDFADLITGYAPQDTNAMKDSGPKKSATRRK